MSRSALLIFVLACTAGVASAACGGSDNNASATATPRPIPSPVSIADQPHEGFTLGDPAFEALPSATADFGRLRGTIYQIEMPGNWNGRLVMYIHGNAQGSELGVFPPVERDYLIENGFAWATSSFTVNGAIVSGEAADDSAALWDFFVTTYGRPSYTYVMGESMGGAAVLTSAERYPDRYDGALDYCGDTFPADYTIDWFVVGAYAAGITQEEFDASQDIGGMVTHIRTALLDPDTRARFEDIWIALTGGPRPFDREGIHYAESRAWDIFPSNVAVRFDGNDARDYQLDPSGGVSSEDFNRDAIRFSQVNTSPYDAGNEVTGDIKIPMINMQSTGDLETVFSEAQDLTRLVDAAGRSDLVVQRAIRDPRHCGDRGFTLPERVQALNDLIAWVEHGEKPDGEDVLGDLTGAGKTFTLAPRVGDEGADDVPGADQRVTLSGTLTLDGERLPEGAFVWAMVVKDGMIQPCSYRWPWIYSGQYEMPVAADAEALGCGAQGAKVILAYFKEGERYLSVDAFDWPAGGGVAQFDGVFSTAHPTGASNASSVDDFFGTGMYGIAVGPDHQTLPAGTEIEAYIGDTVCGAYAVPPLPMVFMDQGHYELQVVGPDAKPGCERNAPITFRINGTVIRETATNDLPENGYQLILHAP